MTRNSSNTGTNTKQTTKAHSKTLVQNQIAQLYSLIRLESDVKHDFLENNRDILENIFEMGLDQERLDEVWFVIVDQQHRIVDEWVLDISYNSGFYELTSPARETVQEEVAYYGTNDGYKAFILPVIDGQNVFNTPDSDGFGVGSFGGPGVNVDIGHLR
ncbi:hypothetical protein [Haloarcula halophila]|uniref:hypothetical protein n=1 Tax=Haloarcula TaxID=2237 RepID=UPI0023E40D02|nr:hypothetical protein [Halomicroarcula sp. DFY41]